VVPTLALTAGVLALALSILAIVLATVANRRHMAARRSAALSARSYPPAQASGSAQEEAAEHARALHALRSRIDSLDDVVAELSATVAMLADPVAALGSRVHALDAGLEGLPAKIERVEDEVSGLRSRTEDFAERAADTDEQILSFGARVEALAEQAAEVLGRTDRLAGDVRAADERAAHQSQLVVAQIQSLDSQVAALRDHVLSADPTALRHVAVVRYDAFADVGGRLSYSLAVLDDTDSGFVVTTLAGKTEVRTYVRAIADGSGDGTLTAEEQQAVEAARQRAGSLR
jgi:uncharacterized protein YoxC